MINLETPKKFRPLVSQAHQVAAEICSARSPAVRPRRARVPQGARHARGDDRRHDGLRRGVRRRRVRRTAPRRRPAATRRATAPATATNLSSVLSVMEMCWGDVGLLLSMPRQGLGNSAIASVADDEQLERFDRRVGVDGDHRAGLRLGLGGHPTTAVRDGDEYVINGEKIYVTAGGRCDAVVVWATLDRSQGPRRDQVLRGRRRARPGMTVERLEHKLGIRASDTATIRFTDCRVPAENLLGSPGDRGRAGLRRRRCRPSTTPARWSPAMAVGCARAALDEIEDLLDEAGVEVDYDRPAYDPARRPPRRTCRWRPTGRPPTCSPCEATWMADNRKPNSLQASMAKAKAGRVGSDITLRCVELAGSTRLQRARPAGEVGARLEDPRHLRGHPADPAADRRAPAARQDQHRAEVGRLKQVSCRGSWPSGWRTPPR